MATQVSRSLPDPAMPGMGDSPTWNMPESKSQRQSEPPPSVMSSNAAKSTNDYDAAQIIHTRHELSSRHSSATKRRSAVESASDEPTEKSRPPSGQSNFESILDENVLPVVTRNNLEKWKRSKERSVEQRLLANIREKKRSRQQERKAAQELERKLPMDVLAREWFNDDVQSVDIRVYLIENLMPTLILGMEKVLKEADKRNLILDEASNGDEEEQEESVPKFDPITCLAQYLMRNNPKFSNLPEASPYARGLRAVSEDLKQQVFDLKTNRVADLKQKARQSREELEQKERKRIEDEERKRELMKLQFSMWLLDEHQRLQLQLIQNGLYSYLEISAHLSSDAENAVHFSKELEPTDETGLTVDIEEFVQFLEDHLNNLSFEHFQDVLNHLNQCALAFRKTYAHELWNSMFVKLFDSLDSGSTGYVDRHRILHLLEKFWDQMTKESQLEVRNPRKWPVIELEELDDLFPESDDGDSVKVSTEGTPEPSEPERDDGSTTLDTETSDQIKEAEPEEEKPRSPSPGAEKEGETLSEIVGQLPEDAAAHMDDEKSLATAVTDASSRSIVTEVVKKETEEKPEDSEPKEEPESVPKVDDSEEPEKLPDGAGDGGTEVKLEEKHDDGKQEDVVEEAKQDVTEETETNENAEVFKEADESQDPQEPPEVHLSPVVDDHKEDAVEEEAAPDADQKEEEEPEEGAQKEGFFDMKQLLLGATEAMTINTPTVTDDGASSEAVKIQFSKEQPQQKDRQVRKTTSYSIVQKGRPQQDDTEKIEDSTAYNIKGNGNTAIQPTAASLISSEVPEGTADEYMSTYFEGSSSHLVQQGAEDMDAALFPYPMQVKTRQASASRMSVTFAAEPIILPDKPSQEFFSEFSSRSQSRMTSVFDENQLNKSRFVSLLETFFNEDATDHIVESLLNFIHLGYIETEEEKMERLARAHREALSAKHKAMIENIFNKWDNDGRGYLEIETIEEVLSKYKGGVEAGALKSGRHAVRQSRKHRFHDGKITRKEFHIYINAVCDAMAGGEEVFDGVIEFVTSTVERTFVESVRGEARRKWLAQVKSAAECSGASMAPVYRFIFQTLFKDAESHGGQKKVSAYIALLENNVVYVSRGELLLRYVACTPDNAPYILGKAFYEDMKGISFYCVRRGKLVHVPRVHSHGHVHFWNPQRLEEEKEGSLVLLPVKDDERRVFALIGIDNLGDPADRSIFATHELNFYQGIAKVFASAFHHVDLKKKLLRIIGSAMSWIHSRAPSIANITVYFVEPDPKSSKGHTLRKMMVADNNTGVTQFFQKPSRLYRKDNLFRDYLFKCMESSDTTTADAYGEYHTAYPLRSEEGHCQCVVDISLGKLRDLPRHEDREMQRMLKLLQAANAEVLRESSGGKRTVILEAEKKASDETRVEIMFDRLMLTDLRDNVLKLDNNVFAELHNYKIPPPMIHNILKAVLMLFYQNEEDYDQFEDWIKCKQLATTKLRQQIVAFDPTATGAVTEEISEKISGLLKGIAHGAVARHGSTPAQQLYNWAFVCLSLIQHTKKSGDSGGQPAVTPLTSASTNTTTDTLDVATY